MKSTFIKIFLILFFLVSIITILPSIFGISTFINNYESYTNIKKYKKIFVMVDSLKIYTGRDSHLSGGYVTCYSKNLNNYKTPIKFGSIDEDDFQKTLQMDENGKFFSYVWYKKGINIALHANKEDKKFPQNQFLIQIFKIPFLCVISILLTYILNRNAKKRGLFNKKI